MHTEVDRDRLLADGSRRQFVGTLGLATLGNRPRLAWMVYAGVLKNFSALDGRSNEFDRNGRPDEFDESSGRTLYEIIYYDRRLGSYWPVENYPALSGAVSAVTLADEA